MFTNQEISAINKIDFKTYSLKNGLKIILYKNNKAPIVNILVWYHVGSKNELPNRTGFAHLFEHLMFQGSENLKKSEHFTYIQKVGGSLNGSTSFDRTDYHETLPSDYLELGLWLEADRMRALDLSQENFDNQRDVVFEEYNQRYVNAPYGKLFPLLTSMLFSDTNYSWTPIGNMDQLAESTLEECKAFHNKFYKPNNATLVVSGDFEYDDVIQLIEKHYSDIEQGDEVKFDGVIDNIITGQKRLIHKDNVPLSKVFIGFKGLKIGSENSETADILALIMEEGRSGRLQSSMVFNSNPIAQQVSCFNASFEKNGMIIFSATSNGISTPEELENMLMKQINLIKSEGISTRELQSAKNVMEASISNTFNYLSGVSNALASNHVFLNDINRINLEFSKYNSITKDNVKAFANEILEFNKSCVLHFVPE
jgi:predicted Zn-dependent peptidase